MNKMNDFDYGSISLNSSIFQCLLHLVSLKTRIDKSNIFVQLFDFHNVIYQ
jgi:hypothetical protein